VNYYKFFSADVTDSKLRYITGILLCILIFFYAQSFFDLLLNINLHDVHQSWFWYSFVISSVLFFILIGRMSFLAIFEHELTHNIYALLTFNRPVGFHVRRGGGGLFEYEGRGNYFITLSPYFSLTFSLFVLLFYGIIRFEFLKFYFLFLGIITGFHTSTTIKETRLNQPDIQRYGVFFSVIFIVFFSIVNYGIVIAFTQGKGRGMIDFLFSGIREIYNSIVGFIS